MNRRVLAVSVALALGGCAIGPGDVKRVDADASVTAIPQLSPGASAAQRGEVRTP